MRRLSLAPLVVLLLALPLACLAADTDSEPAPRNGACVYVRPASTGAVTADADVPQARPALPAAARTTPRPAAPATGTGGGSSSDSEGLPVRNRGSRWHSFLPGMFR